MAFLHHDASMVGFRPTQGATIRVKRDPVLHGEGRHTEKILTDAEVCLNCQSADRHRCRGSKECMEKERQRQMETANENQST